MPVRPGRHKIFCCKPAGGASKLYWTMQPAHRMQQIDCKAYDVGVLKAYAIFFNLSDRIVTILVSLLVYVSNYFV